jgi:pyridoxamine 5'-phosphate oxidase family protein
MVFTDAEERFFTRQPLGHLVTVGRDGYPQVKPVGVTYNQGLGTIDIAGLNMGQSAKYRNIRANSRVALVVDEVTEQGVEGAHFLEIRGDAEAAIGGHDPDGHLAPEIIRIHPHRIVSFNVDPDRPGFEARNVARPRDGSELD